MIYNKEFFNKYTNNEVVKIIEDVFSDINDNMLCSDIIGFKAGMRIMPLGERLNYIIGLAEKNEPILKILTNIINKKDGVTKDLPDAIVKDDPVATDTVSANDSDDISSLLSKLMSKTVDAELSKMKTQDINEEAIDKLISKAIKNHKKDITFVRDTSKVELGKMVHQSFDEMMDWIAIGENTMLIGPAGSGKTSAGQMAAKAMGLDFGSISLSNDTRAYALFGFTNGTTYTSTEFRRLYENGGVFILDEVDNGQANVLSKLNSALEQGFYSFDDKVVNKHEDFICISTANTWSGADMQYVGRNTLDAAFLDRFVKISWGYDEKLEIMISKDEEFTKKVQRYRKAAANIKAKVVISPRTSIRGGRMMEAKKGKLKHKGIIDALIWRGMDVSLKRKIEKEYADML